MLAGWRSQQAVRYLKAKTIRANEVGVRRFAEHVGGWPWEWRASDVDEYFEDLLAPIRRRGGADSAGAWCDRPVTDPTCTTCAGS